MPEIRPRWGRKAAAPPDWTEFYRRGFSTGFILGVVSACVGMTIMAELFR